uniref:Uncharacterized protein n=1 Tax=Cyprinus carpio TaxID=7962 RepID=A0A8C2GX74_CYPCA
MTYPNASVPVVGITPSQMVANVFCTAAGTGGGGVAMGVGMGPKTGIVMQNGSTVKSGTSWPMESLNLNPTCSSQEAEHFEAKWAALESKSQPKAQNPFSNDLQKTFEIEL